ncbi:MAG TPA: IPExxxVDY family protein [Cytophagales bacterium]|nr:IPExxxVDY family protein [Cytophagales bacterium]
MKINKLNFDPEYDEFELIGIVSSLKEYKLAWLINKVLDIKMVKEPDIIFNFINEAKISVSNYVYKLEYGNFRFLKNRASEVINIKVPFLLPELKQYDYLIKLEQISYTFPSEKVIDLLKTINQILFVQELSVNKLKSKENLIF